MKPLFQDVIQQITGGRRKRREVSEEEGRGILGAERQSAKVALLLSLKGVQVATICISIYNLLVASIVSGYYSNF